jgi:hypothetical protein
MRCQTLLLLVAAAGCLRSVPIDGARCPCPEGQGYVCCPATQTCAPAGQSCGGSDAGGSLAPDAGTPVVSSQGDLPGPAPFRRLSRVEFNNTLRDLLGGLPKEAENYPLDDSDDGTGFVFGTTGGTNFVDADQIRRVAEAAADLALRKPTALVPCDPIPVDQDAQETCARQFITGFGLRAFRRPVDDPELQGLLALYQAGRSASSAADFLGAIRLVLQGMLQSPFFLYRWEVTPPLVREGSLVKLGPYEMASRLSYGLWASMPDEALFVAAAANQLATPAQVEQQARRLLDDPRAIAGVMDFYSQLLGLDELRADDKDPSLGLTDAIAQSMQNEAAAFFGDLLVGPGARGTLEDLFTAPSTFVDANLAKLYGVAAPAGGMARVTLDPGQRAGVLTMLPFLAASPDPGGLARRGNIVFLRILCQELPNPATVVPAISDPPPPGATTRQRYETALAGCAGACHPIYPLGWAFENYDALGAYRIMEPGTTQLIDPSGSIPLPSGELAWKTPLELVRRLPQLGEVQGCVGKQWLRYLLRRKEGPGDAHSLAAAASVFERSSHVLREALVALITSRAFSHRTPSPGEELP